MNVGLRLAPNPTYGTCVEKLERLCGDEAVLALGERPRVPEFGEESQLPPLPEDWDDPKAIVWWGQMVREEGVSEGEVRGEERGEERGRVEGKKEGLSEGHEAGLVDGREVGLVEGEERGLMKGRKAVARSLLAEGMNEEQVARLTSLTLEEVTVLRQEM